LLDYDETVNLGQERGSGIRVVKFLTQVLRELRTDASIIPQGVILNAVGAVPPCFPQRQRAAFREALETAGFERVRLMDDTLATLLACRDTWILQSCLAALGGAVLFPSRQDGPLLDELERVKLMLIQGERAEFATSVLGPAPADCHAMPLRLPVDASVFREARLRMIKRTVDLSENVLAEGRCAEPDAVVVQGGVALSPEVRRVLEQRFPGRIIEANGDAVAFGAVLYGSLLPEADWEASGRRAELERQRVAQHENPEKPVATPVESRPESNPKSRLEPRPEPPPEPRSSNPPPASAEQPAPLVFGPWMKQFAPLIQEVDRLEELNHPEDSALKLEELRNRIGKGASIAFYKAAEVALAARKKDRYEALLESANRMDPTNEKVAYILAQLYFEQAVVFFKGKDYDRAERHIRWALDVSNALPDSTRRHWGAFLATCLYLLANIFCVRSRFAEARDLLAQAIKFDSLNSQVALRLKEIEKILNQSSLKKTMSGDKRNKKCPCGSGEKYKKCCGKG
jgi:tetratricopeptide (TPR) repeat protein